MNVRADPHSLQSLKTPPRALAVSTRCCDTDGAWEPVLRNHLRSGGQLCLWGPESARVWESPLLTELTVEFGLDRLICSGHRGKKYIMCTTAQLGPCRSAVPHLVCPSAGTPSRCEVAKLVAKLVGVCIYEPRPAKALGSLIGKRGFGAWRPNIWKLAGNASGVLLEALEIDLESFFNVKVYF